MIAALFGASVALLAAEPARSRPQFIRVVVNGVPYRVPGPGPSSVESVLRASDVHPHGTRLYSALSHKLLDKDFGPPTVLVNGLPATLDSPVRAYDSVLAVNGPDTTEAVVDQQTDVPASGLPEIENVLWYPGALGHDKTTYGALSGEVVARQRLLDPVAPRRELAPVVALTFDDGPDPNWTPQILQLLRDEGIKATFCEVGYLALKHPDLTRQVVADGNVLCDHTMHHVEHLDKAPHAQVVQEVVDGYTTLANIVGAPPPMYRAPGGHLGPDVIGVARGQGMRVLGWAIDPHDYERPPVPVIVERVMSVIRPGAVILFHDGGGDRSGTVAAVRMIIDQLKAMGWSFATPLTGPPAVLPPPPPPPVP